MLGRRLLIVVAILMGVTALTAGLAAPPRNPATPPETVRPVSPADAGATVERTLEVGSADAQTVAVEEGDLLRLSVTGDVLDVVELVGLDRTAPISPETTAQFDVLADEPGAYPVELVSTRARVGTLRITPAQE